MWFGAAAQNAGHQKIPSRFQPGMEEEAISNN
jgi:hypothetical protein